MKYVRLSMLTGLDRALRNRNSSKNTFKNEVFLRYVHMAGAAGCDLTQAKSALGVQALVYPIYVSYFPHLFARQTGTKLEFMTTPGNTKTRYFYRPFFAEQNR